VKSRSLTRELWITNINYKKDIKIDDLGLVIPSGQSKNLLSNNPELYEVDSFVASEIKDVQDYTIAKEMISIYFRKEFDV